MNKNQMETAKEKNESLDQRLGKAEKILYDSRKWLKRVSQNWPLTEKMNENKKKRITEILLVYLDAVNMGLMTASIEISLFFMLFLMFLYCYFWLFLIAQRLTIT